MEKKSEKARRLWLAGDFVGALRLYTTFRLGFSKEEKRMMQIAHEWLGGNQSFYMQIGIDGEACIEQAKEAIKKYESRR